MNKKLLVSHCLTKKGSYEDYPFGPEFLVMKVGSKMFALISERDDKLNISLKCEPFLAEIMRRQYAAVTPGYHLNKKHWNTVVVDNSIPREELYSMIDHSYHLVFNKLTKAEKQVIINACS